MRETRFIRQNKQKWEDFEGLLEEKGKDPQALQRYFIQITDDLSYARTFYPARSVRVYLNQLAQKVFSSIYKKQKSGPAAFWYFWKEEVPAIMYQFRKEFSLALVVFLLAAAIGAWSTEMDKDFPALILGEGYISMTEENIAKGDPMAVYKKANQVDMFLGITLNNILVAFRVYVMGAVAGVGTVLILLYNGIMLGSFQYYFAEKGLFSESFLTIWQHGTLEISAIILAGGAGLVLARGLLFPGSYTRMQSFQTAARRSLRIMLSITPIFIVAGFIEGFVTRYTEVPTAVRITVILASGVFIIGYYVLLPIQKNRSGTLIRLPEEQIHLSPTRLPNAGQVRTTSQIFTDVFMLYRFAWRKLLPVIIVGSLLYAVVAVVLNGDFMRERFSYLTGINSFWEFLIYLLEFEWVNQNFNYLFQFKSNLLYFYLNMALWTTVAWRSLKAVNVYLLQKQPTAPSNISLWKMGITVFASIFIINVFFFFETGGWWLLLFSPLPLVFGIATWYFDNTGREEARIPLMELVRNFFSAYGLHLVMLLIGMVVFILLNSQLLWLFYEVIGFMVRLDAGKQSDYFFMLFFFFTTNAGLMLVLPLFLFSQALWYLSVKEKYSAAALSYRLREIFR